MEMWKAAGSSVDKPAFSRGVGLLNKDFGHRILNIVRNQEN